MHLVSPEELSGLITARLKQQPTVLVALDGRCGSGKTTLSAQLAERFPQSITLHTDDFYLPPPQRVTGWERIPCANMHLERLRAEAVAPARAGRAVCYKAYSCREGRLSAAPGARACAAGHRRGQLQPPPQPCALL